MDEARMFKGKDVIEVGETKVGQAYDFGANVPLNNPNWSGPWDCAEFTSWCVYQAYEGMRFGFRKVKNIAAAEPYSGHWYDDAKNKGILISSADALKIAGAFLIRKPVTSYSKIGHVAISMGDGKHTLEAKGTKFGVGIFSALDRPWTIACLLPDVDYDLAASPTPLAPPKKVVFPGHYLWLKAPPFKSPAVITLQTALKQHGIDPGTIDGVFGPMTHAAVIAFQIKAGQVVDGVVGPSTAKALGLAFPIAANTDAQGLYASLFSPAPVPGFNVATSTPAFDAVISVKPSGGRYVAETASSKIFTVAEEVPFTQDGQARRGLRSPPKHARELRETFGVYNPAAYEEEHQKWAHFIGPTLLVEGGGAFATVNSYDRAAFTFGAPQLAAHTPNRNFIVYLRALLKLENAEKHFPELSLRDNGKRKDAVHLRVENGFRDLEKITIVKRPNGKQEAQLVDLMAWLNPNPAKIDTAELSATARLMNWLRLEPQVARLQIAVFTAHADENLQNMKKLTKGVFTGKNWKEALWIMDILHHGRGGKDSITAALKSAKPLAALQAIGGQEWEKRAKALAKEMTKLDDILKGFTV